MTRLILSPNELSLSFWLCRVHYIIHCAASIRFDLPIQEMMKQNYTTTSNLMDLARDHMPRLECFTYVSTAFVNFNQPDGPQVEERLYPLFKDSPWQDDIAVAERLMSLPEAKATAEACCACASSPQSCLKNTAAN